MNKINDINITLNFFYYHKSIQKKGKLFPLYLNLYTRFSCIKLIFILAHTIENERGKIR